MNLKVLLPSLIITITFLVVLASGFGNNPHEVPFVLEGEPARDFKLVDLDGREVSLTSFRGKPVVINFWSTWCGPCKVEHDILQIGSKNFPTCNSWAWSTRTPPKPRKSISQPEGISTLNS